MRSITISCETAIEQYGDLVYRIAVSQTGNLHDGEDIFQEVFIRLMKNSHKIENHEHLKHWLIRTTVNLTKTYHLCFWKRRVELTEEAVDNAASATAEESEVIETVRQVIHTLPAKLRTVVFLHYYEDYSVEEISRIMNVPAGTVKSRLYRARELLKPQLEHRLPYSAK